MDWAKLAGSRNRIQSLHALEELLRKGEALQVPTGSGWWNQESICVFLCISGAFIGDPCFICRWICETASLLTKFTTDQQTPSCTSHPQGESSPQYDCWIYFLRDRWLEKKVKNRPNILVLPVVIMLGGESEDVFGLRWKNDVKISCLDRRIGKKAMAENKWKLLTNVPSPPPPFYRETKGNCSTPMWLHPWLLKPCHNHHLQYLTYETLRSPDKSMHSFT